MCDIRWIMNENVFPLKVSSLRQDVWYLVITTLCQNTHFVNKILQSRLPHSLEKVVPNLVFQFENDPPFLQQNTDFSAQNDLFFVIKQTFQSKMNPLFCSKTLTFQSKWMPIFTVKHWTLKLTHFSPNSQRWVPKYPLFLGKCESWISSKNTPLFANFRIRMSVVK